MRPLFYLSQRYIKVQARPWTSSVDSGNVDGIEDFTDHVRLAQSGNGITGEGEARR